MLAPLWFYLVAFALLIVAIRLEIRNQNKEKPDEPEEEQP